MSLSVLFVCRNIDDLLNVQRVHTAVLVQVAPQSAANVHRYLDSCHVAVVIAFLGGVDRDLIDPCQLHFSGIATSNVVIGNIVGEGHIFCLAAERQFAVDVGDGRHGTLQW